MSAYTPILRTSSRTAMELALQRVRLNFPNNEWISTNNRYKHDSVKNLNHDAYNGQINSHDLVEYIAASAPLHCADGWSFLSRAIQCHSVGDSDSSRHLGYYAELRAAMSLLAAEGKGIFDSNHVVVDSHSNCSSFYEQKGTHYVAWFALQDLAGDQQEDLASLLAEIIFPGALPLNQWLSEFDAGKSWWPIGKDWLTTWGLDLTRLIQDKNARNEASYRPTGLNQVRSLTVTDTFALLRNLWALFEPAASPFMQLDNHLLRLILELSFEAITNDSPVGNSAFETKVRNAVSRMNLGPIEVENRWVDFLTRRTDHDDPPIIKEARKQAVIGDPHHHVQVIARALLLLRIATGAAARLLRRAGTTQSDLRFWWTALGEDRGLWNPSNIPMDFADLYEDVKSAAEEIDIWAQAQSNPSLSEWWTNQSRNIWTLNGCERIALWGLDLGP